MNTDTALLPRTSSVQTSNFTKDTGPLAEPDYGSLDDRELAAEAASGREGAFRELLLRYERPVFSLVFRMVGNRTLAEDLAQEAFIRAFKGISTYKSSYKFSNWILKIANNHAIDHLRKRRLETISIDGSPNATTEDQIARSRVVIESSRETPAEYAENRELGGQIEQAIARLRPEYRSVVLLRHVEGYAYDEIADIMAVPLGTVKTYLHRARAELRTSLADVAS